MGAPAPSAPERIILHVDMDAFFAAVEVLDDPGLAGRPLVVGGTGRRGVVAAASYEARVHGISSAMPTEVARRRCPGLIVLGARHDRYAEVSATVMSTLRSFSPLVEPLALDEAFVDVTGGRRREPDTVALGHRIRQEMRDRTGLSCAVGAAPILHVAKLASQRAKPRVVSGSVVAGPGVLEVKPDELQSFLNPLPVAALWGVGPATAERLASLGVDTVGRLAEADGARLAAALGPGVAVHLQALARGEDDRVVQPDRDAKSIGRERTFEQDLVGADRLDRELVRLADEVAGRLRRAGSTGRTVTLKLRDDSFGTTTRSTTVPGGLDRAASLLAVARQLVAAAPVPDRVRLVGLSVGRLSSGSRQLSLDDVADPRAGDLDLAVDRIRERFGWSALAPASSLASLGEARGEEPVPRVVGSESACEDTP